LEKGRWWFLELPISQSICNNDELMKGNVSCWGWFFLLFTMIGSGSVFGQALIRSNPTMADTVAYTIDQNFPDEARNLHFIFTPAYFDIYNLDLNIGIDASIYYSPNEQLNLRGSYRIGWFQGIGKDDYMQRAWNDPASIYQPFSSFEIGADYFLSQKTLGYKADIRLKTDSTPAFHKRVPAQMIKKMGIRVGYQHITSIFAANDVDIKGYYTGSSSKELIDFGPETFASVMQMDILSFGVSFTRIRDLDLDFKQFGKKHDRTYRYLYADMMVAPNINLGTDFVPSRLSDSYETVVYVKDHTAKSYLGFRIGETFIANDKLGFSYTFETGIRPGPGDYGNGFYFLTKLGLSLNVLTQQ